MMFFKSHVFRLRKSNGTYKHFHEYNEKIKKGHFD